MSSSALDQRLNIFRRDLADERLRGVVKADRYVSGQAARVIAGIVPLRSSAETGAPIANHLHYGDEVMVFDRSGGFAWCQSRYDGYVGYCDIATLGSPEAPTHYVVAMGCYAYAAADLRTDIQDFLPRHSAVAVRETGLIARGTEYARLDTGLFVPLACLSARPPVSGDLVTAARLYLGCPYLWGGRSFLGIDCSGLVQEAFRDLGVTAPRDTDMQRETIGERVDIASFADLRRNDLLYIPGHVMICAGKGSVVHASGGEMTVRRESLAPLLKAWDYGAGDLTVRRP